MKFALILITTISGSGGSPARDHVSGFASKALCEEAAAAAVVVQRSDHDRRTYLTTAVCVRTE